MEAVSTEAAAKVSELQAQLETAKASMEATAVEATRKEAGLQQQLDDAAAQLKETNAKTLGLKLLMENALKAKETAEGKNTELMGMVNIMSKEESQLTMELASAVEAKDELAAKLAESKTTLGGLTSQVETLPAQLKYETAQE